MVATIDRLDHLTAFTDCIIGLSRIRQPSPREWLCEAAHVVRIHLAPRQVVSFWDGAGASPSRWASVHLGVSAAQREAVDRWNSEFMKSLTAAGITPAVVAQTVPNPVAGRLTRTRYDTDEQRRTIESYARHLGVESLEYFGGPIPPEPTANGGGRTFFLSVWSLERVTAEDAVRQALLAQAWRAAEKFYLESTARGCGNNSAIIQRLTPGQQRVAELLGQGLSKRDIAAQLQRSEHTVHDHTKSIYSALAVNTRAEFMALWAGTRPQ